MRIYSISGLSDKKIIARLLENGTRRADTFHQYPTLLLDALNYDSSEDVLLMILESASTPRRLCRQHGTLNNSLPTVEAFTALAFKAVKQRYLFRSLSAMMFKRLLIWLKVDIHLHSDVFLKWPAQAESKDDFESRYLIEARQRFEDLVHGFDQFEISDELLKLLINRTLKVDSTLYTKLHNNLIVTIAEVVDDLQEVQEQQETREKHIIAKRQKSAFNSKRSARRRSQASYLRRSHEQEKSLLTGFCDSLLMPIRTGDIVKRQSSNPDVHGEYAYYDIQMRFGVPVMLYRTSDAGQIFPRHYTGQCLSECYDPKSLLFGTDLQLLPMDEEIVVVDSVPSV